MYFPAFFFVSRLYSSLIVMFGCIALSLSSTVTTKTAVFSGQMALQYSPPMYGVFTVLPLP